jgi:hypothetical protein
MSMDMRNSLFIWFGILILGGALSHLISKYCAMATLTIWIILFLKDIHVDPDKAFSKYIK